MTTLTIRLPEDTSLRLKQLAASRGMSLNKLMEELGTAVLAAHDTETRFRVLAGTGDRQAALVVLARMDDTDRTTSRQSAFLRCDSGLGDRINCRVVPGDPPRTSRGAALNAVQIAEALVAHGLLAKQAA